MNKSAPAFGIQAAELLRAAEAAQHDDSSTGWTILVESGGQIRIIADCDSPLASLQAEHSGARVFRVKRADGIVRVEGREGARRCVLETAARAGKPQLLISGSAAIAPAAEPGVPGSKPPEWCTTDDAAVAPGIDAYVNLAKLREESVPPLPEASD